jgi:GNAT superfamily N-acetyltransferase
MDIAPIDTIYDGYQITSNKDLMHVGQVHNWLSHNSYWAKGIPFHIVETSFLNSFTVGILKDGIQVGYARLVTDYAVFGYLADVYVLEGHRSKGLGKRMVQAIMEQKWAQGCRRLMLGTLDAHGLYAQFGFTALPHPDRLMVKANTTEYDI